MGVGGLVLVSEAGSSFRLLYIKIVFQWCPCSSAFGSSGDSGFVVAGEYQPRVGVIVSIRRYAVVEAAGSWYLGHLPTSTLIQFYVNLTCDCFDKTIYNLVATVGPVQ